VRIGGNSEQIIYLGVDLNTFEMGAGEEIPQEPFKVISPFSLHEEVQIQPKPNKVIQMPIRCN
jgi:hypothetical protein